VILIKPDSHYRPEMLAELIQRLNSHTNSAFLAEVRLVDEIPPTPGGKHRFLVSEIQVT
jgi:hypothetical protein